MGQVLNLDKSQRVDVICKRGDTFKMNVLIQDDEGDATDVSSYTFHMAVRYTDTDDAIVAQPTEGGFVLSSGSAGTITIDKTTDGANGNVSFTITNTNMQIASGLYVYDIQMTNTESIVETILYGVFKVNEDVTIL